MRYKEQRAVEKKRRYNLFKRMLQNKME